jgi:3-phytase
MAGLALGAAVTVVAACSEGPRAADPQPLAAAAASITAVVETEPVPHPDDAADDAAIWVNEQDPARSTVIGTDKEGGIAVYDLDGRELQYLPDGLPNNVDLRDGFRLGDDEVTLVTAGDRSDDSIAIYRVDPRNGRLVDVAAEGLQVGIPTYGSCMYRSAATDRFYYFVNSEQGHVEQWELRAQRGGTVGARLVRELSVDSQTEGCVADDELGRLYVGEESEGIWRFGAEPGDGTRGEPVDTTGPDGHLTADVEGLAIAAGPDAEGYLVASSQGSGSYVLYERGGDNAFVGAFAIGAGDGIDGTSDTDGIEVTTAALGPQFPDGLLVVQDGDNDGQNQNFKLVDWGDVIGPDGPTDALTTSALVAAPAEQRDEAPVERAAGTIGTDLDAAVAAALAEHPGVVVEAGLDDDETPPSWDVEVVAEDGTRTEVTIDAADGAVLRTELDDDDVPPGFERTSLEDAVTAALGSVPGEVVEAELDDDRPSGWSVEILARNGGLMEVFVSTADGTVLSSAPED